MLLEVGTMESDNIKLQGAMKIQNSVKCIKSGGLE
jgi:hypothetical protein